MLSESLYVPLMYREFITLSGQPLISSIHSESDTTQLRTDGRMPCKGKDQSTRCVRSLVLRDDNYYGQAIGEVG